MIPEHLQEHAMRHFKPALKEVHSWEDTVTVGPPAFQERLAHDYKVRMWWRRSVS
jgi:hypothetical protein